jgi:DNA-binding CsgD family transcriptional regulator
MPRPSFIPTEEQERRVKTMAACGISHENIAARLEITPKTLRKHFRKELTHGTTDAHLAIRQTLFKMATSGRNIAASIYADRVWGGLCARQSDTGSQPILPPQIIIRTEGEPVASAEGGPAQ